MTPLSLLREAVRSVPAVKYALGVAGLISVIAIVKRFGLSLAVAGLGSVVMFALMVGLVLFAWVAKHAKGDLKGPAMFLTWSFMIVLVTAAVLLLTSVFFGRPIDLRPERQVSPLGRNNLKSASQFLNQVIRDYEGFPTYADRSVTIIQLKAAKVSLAFGLESDMLFKRPRCVRIDSVFSIRLGDVPIAKAHYQVYCLNGSSFIYSLDNNEYVEFPAASTDLYQQSPENDPIKQLALAVLKPYAFLLAESPSEPTKRLFNLAGPELRDGGEGDKRWFMSWDEQTRVADKWLGAPTNTGTYTIPVDVDVNESRKILRSRANLLAMFEFLGRNQTLSTNLREYSSWFTNITEAKAETLYSSIDVAGGDVSDGQFQFNPEHDAKRVDKLPSPVKPLQTVWDDLRILLSPQH